MTTTLILTILTIVFATLTVVVAVGCWRNDRHMTHQVDYYKTKTEILTNDVKRLKEEITRITRVGGISEASVLSLIGEIARIDNNLYHMQRMIDCGQMREVPGRKQISKALNRMKTSLQSEDYTIVPLLGTPYREGMQLTAVFVPDEKLPQGESVITSVQKPQVNRGGKMIQAASVTVGQN